MMSPKEIAELLSVSEYTKLKQDIESLYHKPFTIDDVIRLKVGAQVVVNIDNAEHTMIVKA